MTSLVDAICSYNKGQTNLQLHIYHPDKLTLIGTMSPVTIHDLEDDLFIETITCWRNQHMDKFFSDFVAKPERTRKWLHNFLQYSCCQMLFKIYEDSNFVGHLGFKDLNDSSVVLDNAIKGLSTKEPRLFIYAHHVLASWLFRSSNITSILGYVYTDNIPAIMMNKEIGWRGWSRIPLFKFTNSAGESTFSPQADSATASEPTSFCYELLLEYSDVPNSRGSSSSLSG